MNIKLGQKVRDKITGFMGVVTGKVQYISGCHQALVAPAASVDGRSLGEPQWFDEQRLLVTDAKPIKLDNGDSSGSDRQAPKR